MIRPVLSSISSKIYKYVNTVKIMKLQDVYSGNRCFIMGNGPSLNQMELSKFSKEIVFGSNRCYLLYDRINWRPKFYAAVDARVVPDISGELNSIITHENQTTFFFASMHQGLIKYRKNVIWFDLKNGNRNELPFGVFSTKPYEHLYTVATVSITLLQLAVYMGFNPIYLIGCDTNYTIPQTVVADGKHGLISTVNDDSNHFSADYFGKGAKWHNPYVERMIWHYEQSKLACDLLGVKVYNATVGGKLDVFPRVNYLDLFSGEKLEK